MHKITNINKKTLILMIITIIIFLLLTFFYAYYYHKTHELRVNINKINLDKYNKLMIIAHPDDEVLWGGNNLIEDNYLVVCITCGEDSNRVKEFVNVMQTTNDKYIMLNYPDRPYGERDDWQKSLEDITKDLKEIIEYKDWELIVVHNSEGEYGNEHHKLTSSIVTELVTDKEKLYYFGKYYSKKSLANHYDELVSLSDEQITKKKNLIGLYHSENYLETTFDQMVPYETWIPSLEWEDES